MTADEESPFLHLPPTPGSPVSGLARRRRSERANELVIYGSFVGVFLASADESLVISTWSSIASQFNRLSEGSWLLVAYNFGYCVSLPVYGTLSDMYGRKNVLLWAYSLFALGCLACGASGSLIQLILARVLAGISGGGMVALVSIIITDLMPSNEVALFRGYANVVNVAGRSLGAPVGGFLIATLGWRWAFLGQLPLILICIVAAYYGLPSSLNQSKTDSVEGNSQSRASDLDYGGIVSFATAIVILLFLIQSSSTTYEQSRLPYVLTPAFAIAVAVFILTEAYWARKPLIPLSLVKGSLGGYCIGQLMLITGRSALSSNMVPYFVRVEKATGFLASFTYVVTAVGVSVGGLISGAIIKRTKKYKTMAITAVVATVLLSILIFMRYRNGCYTWELFYLFPSGMSNGILFSTQFIGMSLSAPKERLATSIGIYYLSQQLGFIIGPAASVAVVQRLFANRLSKGLEGLNEKQFIDQIINDLRFSEGLPERAQSIVRSSYLYAFQFVPLLGTVSTLIMLPLVLLQKESRIE
ncbi:major facilitator superfamily domain-containing protein [Aspergillus caelatus]|uniref:Major facilitator superfamily domain-containing protein n=1 Tax=Aspergillus caelatus TaxID=61420 RepID=A0A5N6ZZV9_9EURO|nr:major facilitator superfamily domain-containing protein [Aspergillus caelatus]KAE8362456.1 major facilitator superfamily domain-containing protein [Aspergillus caelatus]